MYITRIDTQCIVLKDMVDPSMVVKCHFRGLAFLKLDCITSNLIFSLIKNEYTLFLYGIEQLEV